MSDFNVVKAEHANNTYQSLHDKIKGLDDKIQKYENNKYVNKLFNIIYDHKFIIFNLILLFINIYILYFNNKEYLKVSIDYTTDPNIYNLEKMDHFNLRTGQDHSALGMCILNDKMYFLWIYRD